MDKEKKTLLKRAIDSAEEKRKQKLAEEITEDFNARREARRSYEINWQLNMNFLAGNQYCTVSRRGAIEDTEKDYFWQEREVYNHLATITETRLAKLARVRPIMKVLPFSSEDQDMYTAKMSTAILKAAHSKLEIDSAISEATMWSEVTGTSFYKTVWNTDFGEKYKGMLAEGDVEITVCPPFEIFPDSLSATGLKNVNSLIHAKALSIGSIKELFGVDAKDRGAEIMGYSQASRIGGLTASIQSFGAGTVVREDYAYVIERYTRPSSAYPDGRMEIVAGGVLVYEGSLPYLNGQDKERDFPFVRQSSIEQPGSFFGVSVLDRAIPIQRAFNAVKNRKHEFINRLAMGVLTVEDGSVDLDDLEEEGLSPGKVLIYRQGSNPPVMMDMGRVPSELGYEEDRLLNEFISITGISEIMRNSRVPTGVASGVALQLLIEQDDTRLSITAEAIRNAVRSVSQQILRLYKQFALTKRLLRISDDKRVEVMHWTKSDIGGDDIVFVTENELNETPASKRSMVLELLKNGLLHDENGKLSNAMRAKVLDLLGYGLWEEAQDLTQTHIRRAAEENAQFRSGGKDVVLLEIDDHEIHIREHKRHYLNSVTDGGAEDAERLYAHILAHEQTQRMLTGDGGGEKGEDNGITG